MDVTTVEKFIVDMGATGEDADRFRALAYADDLALFWIENTSGKRAYVIARTHKFARVHAFNAGHIHAINNGECYKAGESFFRQHDGFGSAVKRAIKDRAPGIIVRKGNHAVMGDKVYSPISAVKSI